MFSQSVFHFEHPSQWQSKNKDTRNEDSHVIDTHVNIERSSHCVEQLDTHRPSVKT